MTEEPPARLAKLRPIQQADLPELKRFWWDPEAIGEHDWFGFRMSSALDFERRWHEDGLTGEESSFLAVETDEGACAGWVTWHVLPTGNVEIGIALLPAHRRAGIGTDAQRRLVHHLFGTTPVHRIQARTDVDNTAEQKALERVGFRREGVQRGAAFRGGRWRDGVMYGLLRDDLPAAQRDHS